MFLPLKFQSKYGSSNELLMHFLVREMGPADSLRGQEKWPQNAKSLFRPGGFAPLDPLPGLCPGSAGDLRPPADIFFSSYLPMFSSY